MARSFVKQIQDPVKKERVQDKFARIELKELAWTLVRVVNGRLNKEIKESVTAPDWAVRWDSELKSNEETKIHNNLQIMPILWYYSLSHN